MSAVKKSDVWIDNFMLRIGIRPKFLGFYQLKEAIKYRLKHNDSWITTDIYSSIAALYNCSSSAVERNIRTVIQKAFDDKMLININSLMNFVVMNENYCLTNCELISFAAQFKKNIITALGL